MTESHEEIKKIVEECLTDFKSDIQKQLNDLKKEIDARFAQCHGSQADEESQVSKFNTNESISFKWVKDNLTNYTFQQILGFFKSILNSQNIECTHSQTKQFEKNHNTLYEYLDSIWDQISANLLHVDGNTISDLASKGLSMLSNLLGGSQ